MDKKNFNKHLRRLRNVLIRELMDGCLKCRELKGLCHDHGKEVIQMILDPKNTRLAEEAKHLKR